MTLSLHFQQSPWQYANLEYDLNDDFFVQKHNFQFDSISFILACYDQDIDHQLVANHAKNTKNQTCIPFIQHKEDASEKSR